MKKPSSETSGQAINRRRFLQLSAVGTGLGLLSPKASEAAPESGGVNSFNTNTPAPVSMEPEITELIKTRNPYKNFLTPSAQHGVNYHAKVQPWKMTPEEVKAVGLDRDSYSLEIVLKEGESAGAFLDQPRTVAAGNAIKHADLVRLMEQKPVKFLKTMVCTNFGGSFGNALWEGVALRDVLWLAKPRGAIRRITFISPDLTDLTKAQWHTSRSMSQVFENQPGLPPVFLALKYNGDWLPLLNGGPVRLIVPENYGTQNIKYLTKIILSNDGLVTDSELGNDMESPMKSCAMRLVNLGNNQKVPHDKPLVLLGIAQTGESSLQGAQVAIVPAPPEEPNTKPSATKPPEDDPYLDKLPWKNAALLPPPDDLETLIPGGTKGVHGFDPVTGKPPTWPIQYFYCYFAAVIRDMAPGNYLAYIRSIDRNGIAQPLPRYFGGATGVNDQIFHPIRFEVV